MAVGEIETIPGVDACLMAGLTGSSGASVLPAILWGEIPPSGKTADTWTYDLSTSAAYTNAGGDGVGSYAKGDEFADLEENETTGDSIIYVDADGYYPDDGTANVSLGDDSAYDQVSQAAENYAKQKRLSAKGNILGKYMEWGNPGGRSDGSCSSTDRTDSAV